MKMLKSHYMRFLQSWRGERRRGGGGWGVRGLGESEEIDMEKEEKITNVIWPAAAVIISHSS